MGGVSSLNNVEFKTRNSVTYFRDRETTGDEDVNPSTSNMVTNDMNNFSGIANCNSRHQMQNKGGKNNTLIGMQYVTHMYLSEQERQKEKYESSFDAIVTSFKRIYNPNSEEYSHLHGSRPSWLPQHVLIYDECILDIDIEFDHSWLGRPANITTVDLNDLLNYGSDQDNPIPKRLKLLGSTGFGKSTICTILTRQWAVDHPGFVSNFDLVIRYNLRDLPSRVQSVEEELARFCHSISAIAGDLSLTKKTLKHFADKILLVLDGYDEASPHQRKLVDLLVAARGPNHLFGQSTILVTVADLDGDFLTECDRVARIPALGMNYRKLRQFVEHYFEEDQLKAGTLLAKLDSKSKIFSGGLSPFLLSIICFLHSKDILPRMKSEFVLFETLVTYLLGGPGPQVEALLLKAGQFFYQLLKEGKTAFTPDEIIDVLGPDLFRLISQPHADIIRETSYWEYGGQRSESSLKEYQAYHQLFANFFATKFLNLKYAGLRSLEERTRFLCQLARHKDFHLMVVAMKNSRKTVLLFHCEFNGGVVFRWDIEPGTDVNDLSGSFVMSGDNRDVFIYQLPSVITVLENGNGFKYAEEFFPIGMDGSKAISVLAENLGLQTFPVFYYNEIYRPSEGDLFSINAKCVEGGKVLWKGRVFCYRRLPLEKFPVIDVWSRCDGSAKPSANQHVSFDKFFVKVAFKDIKKEDSNWQEYFLLNYLRCEYDQSVPICNSENLKSGLYVWKLVQCLRQSRLPYNYWRLLLSEHAGVLMYQAIEMPVLNCLLCPDKLVISRANGDIVDRVIPWEMLPNAESEILQKFSFDSLNISLQISGLIALETEEDSSDEE